MREELTLSASDIGDAPAFPKLLQKQEGVCRRRTGQKQNTFIVRINWVRVELTSSAFDKESTPEKPILFSKK